MREIANQIQLNLTLRILILVFIETFQCGEDNKIALQYMVYNNIAIIESLNITLDNLAYIWIDLNRDQIKVSNYLKN